MTTEQPVAQQIARLCQELAGMEVDCHHDKVQAWDTPEGIQNCPDCSGTSKVALFPEVRVPCPHYDRSGEIFYLKSDGSLVCGRCKGRDWVASTDMVVWMEAALTLGDVSFRSAPGSYGNTAVDFKPFHKQYVTMVAGSPFLALLLVLLLALKESLKVT